MTYVIAEPRIDIVDRACGAIAAPENLQVPRASRSRGRARRSRSRMSRW